MFSQTIPFPLHQAYEDVLPFCPEGLELPSNPAEFKIDIHYHALERACFYDLKQLGEATKDVDIDDDEDPNATAFLLSCIRDTKRLQMWNCDAFSDWCCED